MCLSLVSHTYDEIKVDTSSSMESQPNLMAFWKARRVFSGSNPLPPRWASMKTCFLGNKGPLWSRAALQDAFNRERYLASIIFLK